MSGAAAEAGTGPINIDVTAGCFEIIRVIAYHGENFSTESIAQGKPSPGSYGL